MLTELRWIIYFLLPYACCANETGAEHLNKAPAVRQVTLHKEITRFLKVNVCYNSCVKYYELYPKNIVILSVKPSLHELSQLPGERSVMLVSSIVVEGRYCALKQQLHAIVIFSNFVIFITNNVV